jgi:hypothetical protein
VGMRGRGRVWSLGRCPWAALVAVVVLEAGPGKWAARRLHICRLGRNAPGSVGWERGVVGEGRAQGLLPRWREPVAPAQRWCLPGKQGRRLGQEQAAVIGRGRLGVALGAVLGTASRAASRLVVVVEVVVVVVVAAASWMAPPLGPWRRRCTWVWLGLCPLPCSAPWMSCTGPPQPPPHRPRAHP